MGICRSLSFVEECHDFNFVNMRFAVIFKRFTYFHGKIYFHGKFITEFYFFFSHICSLDE